MKRDAPERPPPKPLPSGPGYSTSTESWSQSARKRRKLSHVFEGLSIHVLAEKIPADEITGLHNLIEQHGGKVVTKEHAEIIATVLFKPARLKPLLPDPLDTRVVLHTKWLTDSADAGRRLDYADYSRITGTSLDTVQAKLKPVIYREPAPPKAQLQETPPEWQPTTLSCERWTPLICQNEKLVEELRVIREYRRLWSSSKEDRNAVITYGRAIASIKAYPKAFELPLPKIPYLGDKIEAQSKEFMLKGSIRMARDYDNPERPDGRRFRALRELTQVYGIGPETARQLYDGHYTGKRVASIEALREQCGDTFAAALHYMDDLSLKIPRVEVEEIGELVNRHLQTLAPGAIYTIVGGYRRGKPESNDIDIVFTRPDGISMRNVLDELVSRLKAAGLIAHLISTFGGDSRRPEGSGHHHSSSFDPLDKIFGIWCSKADGITRKRDIYRRVDLISVDMIYYWTAVMGWTGGTQFERDLRRRAEELGYKFDSGGITKAHNQEEVFVHSEEAIFELFQLKWIPPEWRNTD